MRRSCGFRANHIKSALSKWMIEHDIDLWFFFQLTEFIRAVQLADLAFLTILRPVANVHIHLWKGDFDVVLFEQFIDVFVDDVNGR